MTYAWTFRWIQILVRVRISLPYIYARHYIYCVFRNVIHVAACVLLFYTCQCQFYILLNRTAIITFYFKINKRKKNSLFCRFCKRNKKKRLWEIKKILHCGFYAVSSLSFDTFCSIASLYIYAFNHFWRNARASRTCEQCVSFMLILLCIRRMRKKKLWIYVFYICDFTTKMSIFPSNKKKIERLVFSKVFIWE